MIYLRQGDNSRADNPVETEVVANWEDRVKEIRYNEIDNKF